MHSSYVLEAQQYSDYNFPHRQEWHGMDEQLIWLEQRHMTPQTDIQFQLEGQSVW